jgi:glycosyltransferase involved in cell wall biosynthesis
MRLLVVSYAFPPFNSIGGVRVGKTVKYLTKHGHDVRVLTAGEQFLATSLPLEIPEQQVVYSKWLNLRKPFEGGTGEVTTTAATTAPQKNGQPRGELLSRLKRRLTYLARTFLYFPDAYIGWLPYAVAAGSKLITEWRPELILASSPPPTSLLVAHKLSRKYNIPWIADLRDLWVDQHYYRQPAWRKAVEDKLERRVFSSAAGFVTISEPLAETLRTKYGKPTAIVLNGFEPVDYPADSDVPDRDGQIRIVYTGVVHIERQDPTPLFQALKNLGSLAENIRIAFYGPNLGSVRDLATSHNVGHLVEVNDPVPYSDSLKNQAEADILLLLQWNDPAQRGLYTGKLFEYIGARRPILSVGWSDNVAAELIRERNLGVIANDPEQIAAHLKQWLRQKQLGTIPALPETCTAGLSREEQTSALEEYLQFIKDRTSTKEMKVARG